MSEEINKALDELLDDFRYILNEYIDLLESDIYLGNYKKLEQANSINNKYFTK